MKKIIFLITLIFCSSSFSAESDTISSGQPGYSIGSDILKRGYLQYQTNLDHAKTDGQRVNSWNTVIRFGFSEAVEFRGGLDLGKEDVSGTELGEAWSLGLRYMLLDESDAFPLVFQSTYGQDGDDYSINSVLSASGGLSGRYSWGANLIHDVIENAANKTGYILNLMYSLNITTGLFVETYGYHEGGEMWSFFDTGFSYLINKDLQFDASVGYGNTRNVESMFINIGLSGRFQVL